MITGTRRHAERRFHEVRAAADDLAELGVPTDVCGAAWPGSTGSGPRR